jgi:hypothetical protein
MLIQDFKALDAVLQAAGTGTILLALLGVVLGYIVLHATYVYFLSPLKEVPGPFLARLTRLWELREVTGGKSHQTYIDLHKKHGTLPFVNQLISNRINMY